MDARDRQLIQRAALHMAEELGQLGHHEGRWYNPEQCRKFEAYAKNIVTLLRNEGFTIESR